MLQFYFLSIFFNIVTGFVLVNSEKKFIEIPLLNERKFRIALAVLTALTGFIKLFVVVKTDIVILGDLIPAIIGMAGGIALVINEDNQKLPSWAVKIFVVNKYLVGIACFCGAFIHFVFPGALFL